MTDRLLLATGNQDKIGEYRRLFSGLPFTLVTMAGVGITTEVDEVGESLEENAKLKATVLSRQSGLLSLADDSGLEVDALGGEPGPLSARYAGEGASDSERVNYLLSRLTDIPWQKRTAQFRCVISITGPDREVGMCSGECKGYITFEPRGNYGFGYDPIFYLPEFDKTMAELPMEVKNRVSHRGIAARKAYEVLKRLAA
jgi:XTP/dITP diphosphohydrolase